MKTKKYFAQLRNPSISILALLVALALIFAQSPMAAMAEEPGDALFDHFIAYKYGSKAALGPSQTLTYTILLYNSGIETVTADILDTLPEQLAYVAGSASNQGVYNAGDHAVSWTGIEIAPVTQVKLTFEAMAPNTVAEEVVVTNMATITTGTNEFDIEADTTLLTNAPTEDVEYPVVESVTIDEGDALTTREVTLYIDATDNVGVDKMLIREYQVFEKPNAGWDVSEDSDWVEYEAEYEYTLGDLPGVHFIGVWVADEAGNVSHATQESFDFASYLEDETTIANQITNIPYAIYYDTGVDVNAVLTQKSGEESVCLNIWYAGNYDFFTPDHGCENDASFTTEAAGTYLFIAGIQAPEEVSYNLSITPAGGPNAWGETPERASLESTAEAYSLFAQIGLNPISTALADQPAVTPSYPSADAKMFHLPLLMR